MASDFSYPLPAHAASIWIAGDILFIAFPSTSPGVRGHTVELRINENTMLTLIHVLRSRARSTELDRMGKPECPTQYNLDKIMASFGGTVKVVGTKRSADQDITLEDLDI